MNLMDPKRRKLETTPYKDARLRQYGAQGVYLKDILYTGGGYVQPGQVKDAESTIFAFNISEDKWSELPTPTKMVSKFALARYNDHLLIAGGEFKRGVETIYSSSVQLYEEENMKWTPFTSMPTPRCNASAVGMECIWW